MARYIDGNSWKHRNDLRSARTADSRRKFETRKLTVMPQYKWEDLYISPFKQQRVYDADGNVSYVALEQEPLHTGIDLFDQYIRYIAAGGSCTNAFAEKLGAKGEDFSSLVFLLTGMKLYDFRIAYQLRIADDLLRYTDMAMPEVARRSGLGTPLNLYYIFKREYNIPPGRRRHELRKKDDLGRYK